MDLTTTIGYVDGFAPEFNLRELGGLPTSDGRRVRRGFFYRGSPLVGLSPDERARVDAMGLRYVLDLRARGEALMGSDHVPEGARYERIGGMRTDDGAEMDFSPEAIERLEREHPEILESGDFMVALYVGMAWGNPAVHALVDHVVAGEAPVYFHCTAGKDRTGVCAAVLGMVLGIERDAIIADFLLTNEYRRSIIESVADRLPADTPLEIIERWKMANGVQVDHLLAVFADVEDRCGSVERYLDQEFGLDADRLAALRDRYLE
jgi:protein-tyrosine phosphatase